MRYEGSPEIEKIKKILNAEVSTKLSEIISSLSRAINEADQIKACKSQDACSLPQNFNFVLPEDAPVAIFETYTDYKKNADLNCGENCKYADLVENAEEMEKNVIDSLGRLNVGEEKSSQSALIENFASISADELE